jgi:hypothetical protein
MMGGWSVPCLCALDLGAGAVGGGSVADRSSSAHTDPRVVTVVTIDLLTLDAVRARSNCHASYDPCIPDGPDLDCPDIGHRVTVIGPDEYRLNAEPDEDDAGYDIYPEPSA